MKKLGFSLLVALVLIIGLVGCDALGENGNPKELTGTWTATGGAESTSTLNTNTVADDWEGTWAATYTTNPSAPIVYVQNNGTTTITYTQHGANETTTKVATVSRVIAANGSYTETVTVTTTVAARDAIPAVGTGTTQTNGAAAIVAGTSTCTRTKTVTATANLDESFQERVVTLYTYIATGSQVGLNDPFGAGLTYTTVSQTSSTDQTSQVSESGLSFDALYFGNGISNYDQTVTPEDTILEYTYAITRTLAFGEDGVFTMTTNQVKTQADPVGTATTNVVQTGTFIGNGLKDGNQLVTLHITQDTTTYTGTGALVSTSFPATAKVVETDVDITSTLSYYISKDNLAIPGIDGIFVKQ